MCSSSSGTTIISKPVQLQACSPAQLLEVENHLCLLRLLSTAAAAAGLSCTTPGADAWRHQQEGSGGQVVLCHAGGGCGRAGVSQPRRRAASSHCATTGTAAGSGTCGARPPVRVDDWLLGPRRRGKHGASCWGSWCSRRSCSAAGPQRAAVGRAYGAALRRGSGCAAVGWARSRLLALWPARCSWPHLLQARWRHRLA